MVCLVQSAAPHRWRSVDGRLLEMDTVHDVRARELKELYSKVSVYPVDKQQRLHVLDKLRNTVMVKCTRLTEDVTLQRCYSNGC